MLTDKQEKFVQELIKGKSQREAYKLAYNTSKMTDVVIDVKASELLKNGKVAVRYAEIHDRLVKEAEDECIISAKEVLQELKNIAFANGTDYTKVIEKSYMEPIFDDEGNKIGEEQRFYKAVEIKPTEDVPEDKRKAIAGIKQTKNGIEVNTCDKVKALELLGKHLKLFTDKVETEITGETTVNNKIDFSHLTTEQIKELLK